MNWDEELQRGEAAARASGTYGIARDEGAGGGPPEPPAEPGPVARACSLPLNDLGNGQRLVLHFGENLMFVPRIGWFVWEGRVWAQDFDGMRIRRLAHRIPGLIAREAYELDLDLRGRGAPRSAEELEELMKLRAILEAAETGIGLRDHLRAKGTKRSPTETLELQRLEELIGKGEEIVGSQRRKCASRLRHARTSGNTSPISNMLKEAEPLAEGRLAELNVEPLAVNCESGTLEFLAGPGDPNARTWAEARPVYALRLRPHDRADRITKMMPVAWDPAAACPAFDRFLAEIQPQAAMRGFLQRWFGYSLTGLTAEQKLVFLYGTGRNGKTTLVDLIARMMGEYATSLPVETLTGTEARKGADATPDLIRIPGARMVRAGEPEEGIRFREALVKLLTGGEPILIRRMREEFVEVSPIFKLTISGNHKPNVRGTDEGIWRRILLVPFAEQVAADAVDHELPRKLWAERSGVLNWLLAGALAYLDGGLAEPPEVVQATAEFRDDSDPVRGFLMEACEITGDAADFLSAGDAAEAFQLYQRDRGGSAWSPRMISLRLAEKADAGFRAVPEGPSFWRHRTETVRGYAGLRLTAEMDRRMLEARFAAGGRRAIDPEGGR
ncbi:MAG TPA: phage/plasmid primase, P4 family [Paracoccaceae bacterium]|nr:phage/plasmid primase, P4 family [Paracoccaceae bacterium]